MCVFVLSCRIVILDPFIINVILFDLILFLKKDIILLFNSVIQTVYLLNLVVYIELLIYYHQKIGYIQFMLLFNFFLLFEIKKGRDHFK